MEWNNGRTDGTSRDHERREEKKRDKRGRGHGRGLDLDFQDVASGTEETGG